MLPLQLSVPYDNSSYSIFIVTTITTANFNGIIGGVANTAAGLNIRVNPGPNIQTYWLSNDLAAGAITASKIFLYGSFYQSGGVRSAYTT
jgi:hypothetical protein